MKTEIQTLLENSDNIHKDTAKALIPVKNAMTKIVQYYYDNYARVPNTNLINMPLSTKLIEDPIEWLLIGDFDSALDDMDFDLDILCQLIDAHEAGRFDNTSADLLNTLKQALSLLERTKEFIENAKEIHNQSIPARVAV